MWQGPIPGHHLPLGGFFVLFVFKSGNTRGGGLLPFVLAHGRFLLGWRLSLARTELSRADRRSLYRVFWKQAQRQHMAGSLLFETVGGSCLDRGHLTGPSGRGGSPRPLSAPSHDTVAVLYHPGP